MHRRKSFTGTDYIEIAPGIFSGLHWQDGYLFVAEDDFLPAEGIVRKYFEDYDHYGMNNIPIADAKLIAGTWAAAAVILPSIEIDCIRDTLHLFNTSDAVILEIAEHRIGISRMLKELAHECMCFINEKGTFCILGL